jgi:hypothetical protein
MEPILLAVLERHLMKAKCCGNCMYFKEYETGACDFDGDHETDERLVCDEYKQKLRGCKNGKR